MFNIYRKIKHIPGIIDENPMAKIMDEAMHDENTKLGQFVNNYENAVNPINRIYNECKSMSLREARIMLCMGDHIACMRTVYSHHGIYDGNDGVYEYNEGVIRHVRLAHFADGCGIIKVDSPVCFSEKEIIARAESRMGERDYNLFSNNCENFARWCRAGESSLL